jgi:hypothetical protein
VGCDVDIGPIPNIIEPLIKWITENIIAKLAKKSWEWIIKDRWKIILCMPIIFILGIIIGESNHVNQFPAPNITKEQQDNIYSLKKSLDKSNLTLINSEKNISLLNNKLKDSISKIANMQKEANTYKDSLKIYLMLLVKAESDNRSLEERISYLSSESEMLRYQLAHAYDDSNMQREIYKNYGILSLNPPPSYYDNIEVFLDGCPHGNSLRFIAKRGFHDLLLKYGAVQFKKSNIGINGPDSIINIGLNEFK